VEGDGEKITHDTELAESTDCAEKTGVEASFKGEEREGGKIARHVNGANGGFVEVIGD